MDSDQAKNILGEMGAMSRSSAAQLKNPWWQAPLLSVALAGLVLAQLVPSPWNAGVALACFAVTFLELIRYTRQPVWVSGWRRGWTLPLSIAFLVAYLALYAASYRAWHEGGNAALVVALAGGVFILTLGYSVLWMRVWRAEMARGH